jgi:hypothetical protein
MPDVRARARPGFRELRGCRGKKQARPSRLHSNHPLTNRTINNPQTEQSLLRTPPLVLDLIAHALDQDIFDTAPAPISEADLGHPHVRVLQNGSDDAAPRLAHRLVSDPEARVVAVVERDADLDLAARELVRARFALRGRSPYAPDVVLVNEWVKREFLEAALRHAVRVGGPGGGGGGGGGEKTGLRMGLGPQGPVADAVKKERGVSVLSWSAAGAVVDVEDRLVFWRIGLMSWALACDVWLTRRAESRRCCSGRCRRAVCSCTP